MNKNTMLAVAWPTTLVTAFFVGQMATKPASGDNGKEGESKQFRSAPKRNSFSSAGGSSNSGLAFGDAVQVRSNVVRVARVSKSEYEDNFGIEKIATLDDPLKRSALLLSIIQHMDAEDFPKVVDDFRKLGITEDRMSEYQQLLHAWAQKNPEAAIDYATKNTRGNFARETILASWSANNPYAAIEWAEANFTPDKEGKKPNPHMVGVIKGIATKDVAQATELLQTLPLSRERGQALDHLLKHISTDDKDTALAWLDSITDERLKRGATSRLVEDLAEADPAGIAEWVSNIEDETTRKNSLREVADEWAEKNIKEATDWISTLEESEKMSAARGVIGEYTKQDATAAAEWMNSMKGQEGHQEMVQSYIRAAARSQQPEAALEQIANIEDKDKQNQTYRFGLNMWAWRDPQAASKWLEANKSKVPEDITKQIAGRLEKAIQNQSSDSGSSDRGGRRNFGGGGRNRGSN